MLIELAQIEQRVNSPDNILNRLEIQPLPKGGNPYGRHGRGIEIQTHAAVLAQFKTSAAVARETGYSEREVKYLKIAEPNQNGKVNQELANRIDEKMDEVRDKALERTMEALGLLDEEKMEKCNAKDLSVVAANMSKVASNTGHQGNIGAQLNVIVYAPRQKELKEFDFVDV